jgi:hypothetical protein
MRARVVKKSKYKGVALLRDRQLNEFWACRGEIDGRTFFSKHETEREAAIQYDQILIRNLQLPINIYVQK